MTPQTQFTPNRKKASKAAHSQSGEAWIDVEADTLVEAERLHSIYAKAPSLYAALKATVKSLEWVLMAMPDIPNPSEFRSALEEAKKALAMGSGGLGSSTPR